MSHLSSLFFWKVLVRHGSTSAATRNNRAAVSPAYLVIVFILCE